MPNKSMKRALVGAAVALSLAGASQSGCSCGSGEIAGATGGADGGTTSSEKTSSATGKGGSLSISVGTSGTGGKQTVECTTPCDAATQVCSHGTCIPIAACMSDNDCQDDTYCDPKTDTCQPWTAMMPSYDPNCINAITPGVFAPKVKCEFTQAPMGDPFPQHLDVQGTPSVVNFNNPPSSGVPSIVAAFTATVPGSYTENMGIVRVLKGDDCSLEANLGGVDLDGDGAIDWMNSPSTPAVGDLDGDGVADIVEYGGDNSIYAFTKKNGAWQLLWKAPPIPGVTVSGSWAGPSIYDIDDDGAPEVLCEGAVLDNKGNLKSGQPTGWQSYSQGLFGIVANLDQDPNVEITNGQYIWEWQPGTGWVQESYFPGMTPSAPGQVAIADFGAYGAGLPSKNPEIAVVRDNTVMVYAADGTLAMPPVAVPGKGGGGPPTISDFDGDGLPEVAVAGQAYYTIYDIDCGPNPRPGGKCDLGPCDFMGGTCPAQGYILWSRASQDISSNITGSSVFDFEADGVSEVIYADECFTRVYNGQTGEVEFSRYRSSCTWYENPVVADTDGNFRADLVVPSNLACSDGVSGIPCTLNIDASGGTPVDALFAGLRCKTNADCVSNVCDNGLCRCMTTADCCQQKDDAACTEEGHVCTTPPMGTPGTGNTCRAGHPHGVTGIRVYSDANDKWVRSRTIWNQHAYSITNVNEDGTVPKTSMWQNNWDVPKLNNFRQNVPGNENGNATGDATAGPDNDFDCIGSQVNLSAPVCNRGSDPIGANLSVGFYVNGMSVCETKTKMALQPGDCETVTCQWSTPPGNSGAAVDVTVKVNDKNQYAECKSGNDTATIPKVFCKQTG